MTEMTRIIEIDKLDKYSIKVLEYFKKNFSDLLNDYEMILSESDDPLVRISYKCPNSEINTILTIDTEGQLVTVCFDYFHWHFDGYADMNFHDEMNKAINLCKQIFNEDLMILRYVSGQKIKKTILIDHKERKILLKNPYFKENSSDTIKLFSWNGQYDKIVLKDQSDIGLKKIWTVIGNIALKFRSWLFS